MGAWGIEAWENDSAADWFMKLFMETELAEFVEKGLVLDVHDEPEVIRAAALILVALGRNYIWPIDDLNKHLMLAIEKLEIINAGLDDGDDIKFKIEDELSELRSRIVADP